MDRYATASAQVAADAYAAGMDSGQAATAWGACVRHIADNPATFCPVAGETRDQRRSRIAKVRKQRGELRRVASFALGATLLTLLLNWAIGRLINWVLDRALSDVETTPASQWEAVFAAPPQQFMAMPPIALPWHIRAAWVVFNWFVDWHAVPRHKE